MQVTQGNRELAISEQGQITNRFNNAIKNLGSTSLDIRLGGIYALERIMHDSARDHQTVTSVLSAYARQHSPVPAPGTKVSLPTKPTLQVDIQAVMTVLANRGSDRGRGTPIDLSRTALQGMQLAGDPGRIDFRRANLEQADLRNAVIRNVNLSKAWLFEANLSGAALEASNFSGATLWYANLAGTAFCSGRSDDNSRLTWECSNLTGAYLVRANLKDAALMGADLTNAKFCLDDPAEFGYDCANLGGALLSDANLEGAFLSGANLKGADLTGANLTDADLSGSNLTGADLTGAKITGTKFEGTKLNGALGLPPSS
uniref:Pentapeptide repeat-containing protein n=1 Tax=Streptomyces sp. NBC_01393 TaxID=2903851 RepID=A0AAU3I5V3_9ACTN